MTGTDTIVVLDFDAASSRLLARRVREAQVFSEILPGDTPPEKLKALAPRGIILGGPGSNAGAPRCHPGIFHLGIPVLAIGYGMGLLVQEFGGEVAETASREDGAGSPAGVRAHPGETQTGEILQIIKEKPLFSRLPAGVEVRMSQGDRIREAPPGFAVLAATAGTPIAAVGDDQRRLYGVQFHPGVFRTAAGFTILQSFLYGPCDCRPSWTPQSFIDRTIAGIKEEVGDGRVLCALSGGVDSAVSAVLAHRAIGSQLTCVFVDHGLLRKNEAAEVQRVFAEKFRLNLIVVDAAERFLNRLRGVVDPEEKRRVVGEEFIRVFEEEARKLGKIDFLLQGTLYPDVIESMAGNGQSVKVKSHHNVGGLPADLQFKLLEPLRLLFKDEVRVVGKELGIPDEVVWRQPFPGPGLAVRVIGEVTPERLALLREADSIVNQE
ncbi:MAG: glutamine-hydrolyzing GMP synthase, partial [Clostridia bacterium]|nr:glutamine-hydrolyzing GMP synthase [Clostridia bacterium]